MRRCPRCCWTQPLDAWYESDDCMGEQAPGSSAAVGSQWSTAKPAYYAGLDGSDVRLHVAGSWLLSLRLDAGSPDARLERSNGGFCSGMAASAIAKPDPACLSAAHVPPFHGHRAIIGKRRDNASGNGWFNAVGQPLDVNVARRPSYAA